MFKFQKQLRIKNPSDSEVPPYYLNALKWSYILLIVYLICYGICTGAQGNWDGGARAVPWLLAAAAALLFNKKIPVRWNLLALVTLTIGWVLDFIFTYGWQCGVQHFIMSLMVVSIFSIYDSLLQKLGFILAMFALRVCLFFWCMDKEPLYRLSAADSAALQVLNTAFIFANMVAVCLIFSTNIQESEKQLMIYNQELQKQACTDSLTKLPNRRYMMDMLERQISVYPKGNFCVAMGDIDLFKNINDTLGHNCGDEVLRRLGALFREMMEGKGCVCRWGGEEFFFFLPNCNLDEASVFMSSVNVAVSHLEITYKGAKCRVTMTFGVEEYDYHSNLAEVIKRADDKLYIGKKQGRDRVIF